MIVAEPSLSKRERQIMDAVFQLGDASAADVRARLPAPPTDTAVRTMLRLLEEKGWLKHRQVGRKFIYSPCRSPKSEGRSAMSRVLNVFFGGSLEDAVAAHLSDPSMQLDSKDFERLRSVIDEAAGATKKTSPAKTAKRNPKKKAQ